MWLAGQVGGASAAAWTHVPHHVSWCGPSLHVSHFPNQIESSNCCPALLPALVERHRWRLVSSDIMCLSWGGSRECWMIYRGQGFLAIVWFGSFPTPSYKRLIPVTIHKNLILQKNQIHRLNLFSRVLFPQTWSKFVDCMKQYTTSCYTQDQVT